jgi:Fe-Mn family superoxide dismutase
MEITLPKLPYEMNALEPHISAETLNFHYFKHHQGYVDKTNKLLRNTPMEGWSLEDVVKWSRNKVHNNAAQVWNHNFYWQCMIPASKAKQPELSLKGAIRESFGGQHQFFEQFTHKAMEHFGSGWAWLIRDSEGGLSIQTTHDAESPLCAAEDVRPLLVCDLWEHAYYIDFRNERARYLESFYQVINWEFVSECYDFETPAWAGVAQ